MRFDFESISSFSYSNGSIILSSYMNPVCLYLQVKSIACGHMHTLCLTSRGIYSWGSNKYGQLGLGHPNGPGQSDEETIVTKPMPVPLFNQEKATQVGKKFVENE